MASWKVPSAIVLGSAIAALASSHAKHDASPRTALPAEALLQARPASETAATPAAAAATPTTQPVSPRRQAPEPPTHAQLVAQVEANIRVLDARFMGEPRDAQWAAQHERAIADFFGKQSQTGLQLQSPARLHSACHSASCRVAAHYPDVRSAEEATQQLAMQLGDRLPYGAVMPRLLADGSVEVNAWYSAQAIAL